jgi:hypothetical protein
MVADSAREADPARLSKRLQSRRDVHLIPEDIVLFSYHVAEIDPV